MGPGQVGLGKVDQRQVGSGQVHPGQHPEQVHPGRVGPGKVHPDQVHPGQVRPGQMNPRAGWTLGQGQSWPNISAERPRSVPPHPNFSALLCPAGISLSALVPPGLDPAGPDCLRSDWPSGAGSCLHQESWRPMKASLLFVCSQKTKATALSHCAPRAESCRRPTRGLTRPSPHGCCLCSKRQLWPGQRDEHSARCRGRCGPRPSLPKTSAASRP